MAGITFPRGQEATVTWTGFGAGVLMRGVAPMQTQRQLVNVNTGTVMTYEDLLPNYQATLTGKVTSNEVAFGKGTAGTFSTSNTEIDAHVHEILVVKEWPFFDVTGAKADHDGQKRWEWGTPATFISVRASLRTDAVAIHSIKSALITATLPGAGSLVAGGFVQASRIFQRIEPGGPITADFNYGLSGTVAYTEAASTDLKLGSDDKNPPSSALSLSLDSAAEITTSGDSAIGLLKRVEMRSNFSTGDVTDLRAIVVWNAN